MDKFNTLYNQILESVKKKVVYRDKKREVVNVSTKDGYKLDGNKEIRMSSKEKLRRSRAAKRTSKSPNVIKKRVKSFEKTYKRIPSKLKKKSNKRIRG
jgi:hypothetical protein